jgi:hypothetical protein
MDLKVAEEFLDELFSSLEAQETQSAAVLQFLKDHGNATDEQLASYMERASKASNVRWRATRLRLMSLLSSAVKDEEKSSKREPSQQSQKSEKDEKSARPQEKSMSQEISKPEAESKKENAAEVSGQKPEAASPSKDEKAGERSGAEAGSENETSAKHEPPKKPREAA